VAWAIFEELSKRPATPKDPALWLVFHLDAGERLMIGLERLRLLIRDGERYSNSGLADPLTSSAPVPLSLLLVWGKLFYPIWKSGKRSPARRASLAGNFWLGATGDIRQPIIKDADALRPAGQATR